MDGLYWDPEFGWVGPHEPESNNPAEVCMDRWGEMQRRFRKRLQEYQVRNWETQGKGRIPWVTSSPHHEPEPRPETSQEKGTREWMAYLNWLEETNAKPSLLYHEPRNGDPKIPK